MRLTHALRLAWTVFRKDLTIELRTREITATAAFFALVLTVLVSMSFFNADTKDAMVAPVLWVVITFSGVLVMTRLWDREREGGMLRALLLSPVPRSSIYLGKAAAALAFLTAIEVLLLPLVAVLFDVNLFDHTFDLNNDRQAPLHVGLIFPQLVGLVVLGSLGFVSIGTLFSAMTAQTTVREFVFTSVLFPLVSPVLLSGVAGTSVLLRGASWAELSTWYTLLGVLAAGGVFVGVTLFEYLTSE